METEIKGFPQISVRHQTIDLGRSNNPKQDKCKNLYPSLSYSNNRKSRIKKKILKEAIGKNLPYRGIKIRILSNFSETMQANKEWSEIFEVLRKRTTNL